MTEQEWLTGVQTEPMLKILESEDRPAILRPTDREYRLFACACTRLVWQSLDSKVFQDAVVTAELHADGKLGVGELFHHRDAVATARRLGDRDDHKDLHWYRTVEMASECCRDNANGAAYYMVIPVVLPSPKVVADVMREIFGNPFRPIYTAGRMACPDCPEGKPDEYCDDCSGFGWVRCPCGWLTPQVQQLAKVAYEQRHPDGRLDNEILGAMTDAMEEAGCDDGKAEIAVVSKKLDACFCDDYGRPECEACTENRRLLRQAEDRGRLLEHLRSPGPHFRGCHALDLLLERD